MLERDACKLKMSELWLGWGVWGLLFNRRVACSVSSVHWVFFKGFQS